MIVYSEEKAGKKSVFYNRIISSAGAQTSTRKIICPLYKVEKNNFTYFLLYYDDMHIISPVYAYLNIEMRRSPFTTRSKSAHALRLLYCFLALSKCSPNEISEQVFDQMICFLKGINGGPNEYSLKTLRTNSTINGYMSIYRNYFRVMDIPCVSLFRHRIDSSRTFSSKDFNNSSEQIRFDKNLRTSQYSSDTVPKYISPSDYKEIFSLALQKKDRTARIIFHLAYGYGLRLGEILGITLEDIIEVHENGKTFPVIILRNRISDRRFQFSKGLMHPIDRRQYFAKDYRVSNWRIPITYDFYDQLIDYIETTHAYYQTTYPANYERTQADIVSYSDMPDRNHYVFLNRYGRVLSDQTWNNQLRAYYINVGIPFDRELQDSNLTHRFRHGFAMFHARFSPRPVDALVLQKMLRHASMSSTMIYYNPTSEDEFRTKTEFQEDLYSLIPELKESKEV